MQGFHVWELVPRGFVVATIESGVVGFAERRSPTWRPGSPEPFSASSPHSPTACPKTSRDRSGDRLPWSNGQTEGQVCKLKLVKPQMYGRGNLDLLQARVIGLE
jgi:hypothetical protein